MYPEQKIEKEESIPEVSKDIDLEGKYSRSSLYKDAWRRLKRKYIYIQRS